MAISKAKGKLFAFVLGLGVALAAPLHSQVFNPGIPFSGSASNNDCVKAVVSGGNVQSITGNGAPCAATPPVGANPVATAGPAAINGTATTFMRSDAAPAIQLGTNAQKGLLQVDGTSLTASGGVASAAQTVIGAQTLTLGTSPSVQGNGAKIQLSTAAAVTSNDCAKFDANGNVVDAGAVCGGATGANPTATATTSAVNGVATTFMRSDAAPAVGTITFGGQSAGPGQSATMQGTGAKIQASTGTTTTNDCVKFDANGNTVDAGAACQALTTPITPANGGTGVASPTAHTIPVAEGASNFAFVGPGTTGQCVRATSSADPIQVGGCWVLLNTLTASSSASLSDTTSLTSTYNEYLLVLENLLPATTNVTLTTQVHSGGTFQTTTYLSGGLTITGGGATSGNSSTTGIACSDTAGGQDGVVNTGDGVTGWMMVFLPSSTTVHKKIHCFTDFLDNGGTARMVTGFGWWNGGLGAVDGFQILFSSGNITSGTIKVYGRL